MLGAEAHDRDPRDALRRAEERHMTGDTPVWDPHFIETLEGSFSAVSTPLIARNGEFCSIFRDLQDLHSSALLESKWKKNMENHLVDPNEKT